MICPNDGTHTHPIAVPSHYGEKITIDQCKNCGGLWFDAFELYKVKPDADELVEDLDAASLRLTSEIENTSLRCPHDKAGLFRFEDSRFPSDIVLMRCPVCQGFWLNRGEFTKYQASRQKNKQPEEKSPDDRLLDEKVNRLLESHRAKNSGDVLGSLGSFLSTPVGERPVLPMGGGQGSSGKEFPIDAVLSVLVTILRLVFRI